MTSIKLVAFAAEAVLTVIIVIAATLRVHDAPAMYGWRGFIAMAISTTATTLVLGLGVWSIFYRLSTRASRSHDAAAPSERSVSLRQPTRDAQYGPQSANANALSSGGSGAPKNSRR